MGTNTHVRLSRSPLLTGRPLGPNGSMAATRPRFADPTLCPDCRSVLPVAPFRCPTCSLPLQGFLATELLRTLTEADDLLVRLRASAPLEPTRTPVPATVTPAYPSYPAPTPAPPARRGLQGASVPKILLGLGATCLLVAAVIFLAVAWTWLGVGGRTAVLVAMTATTGAVGTLLGRRGLRVAAEALTTVALGLVVLDVVGADNAGWFGDLSVEALVRLVGVGVLVPSLALSVPRERLVVPQLVAPVGLGAVLASIDWTTYAVGAVDLVGPVCVLALAALVVLARRLGAQVLAWAAGILAAAVWAGTGMWALAEATAHPTAHQLWVDGHGWELVVAALLTLLVWGIGWSDSLLREGAATVVVCALTFVGVLPLLDGSQTQVTLVALGVVLGWTVVAAVTPPGWYVVPRVPLAAGALVASVSAAVLAGAAVTSVLSVGRPFDEPAGVRLDPDTLTLHPLLLLATVAVLAVAALLASPRTRWTVPASGTAVAVAGLLTLGLHPVPLWTVLAVLALVAGVLTGLALRAAETGAPYAVAAAALAGVLVVAALPSVVLTTVALTLVVAALVTTLVAGRFELAAEGAGLALPVGVGALIWSVAELAEVDPALRAAPVLVVLGVLAIGLPRLEVEATAAGTGLVVALAAFPSATDGSVWLAVHLTVAGALVTASSIVHGSRRVLAWPGGALLAAATWVRLWDLQVVDPEPYTLPTAAALVAVGLHRMSRADGTATMSALAPGLVLATVPSLLWVLGDPVTLRAGVLGLACLLLLLAGVQLRWHAPVVVGSVVGGLVVLRELAPYALETPQWVVIGLAGTVLIACGVTWESRMRDLQHAASYLGRLR